MGILDDIREQASQKQQALQEDSLFKQQLEQNYQIKILPKLQQLYSYFKELFEYLNIIDEPIPVLNYSNRYPQLGELYQTDYHLSSDKHGGLANYDKLTEIILRFYCLGRDEQEFIHYADNRLEAEQEQDFLSSHKIKYRCDRQLGNTKAGAVTFYIHRKIPVFFHFSVDYEQSRIRLVIHNHENFEQRSQYLNPDVIDESFMDKLARYILRKDQEFLRMDIDDSQKQLIRQNLEAQKQAHEQELQAAQLIEQQEHQAEQSKKVSHKVKTFIKSGRW